MSKNKENEQLALQRIILRGIMESLLESSEDDKLDEDDEEVKDGRDCSDE